jgi:thiamine transport system ATP-binding protein
MFQDYALFPPVCMKMWPRTEMKHLPAGRHGRTETLLLGGLAGYDQRDVNTLSGGEQQRVALARALAPSPPLMLTNRSAAGPHQWQRLVVELREITTSPAARPVRHPRPGEAFSLADRVVVMNAGKVEQIGTPNDLPPAGQPVRRFPGLENLLPGQIDRLAEGGAWVSTAWGVQIPTPPAAKQANRTRGRRILMRPGRSAWARPHSVSGRLVEAKFRGAAYRLTIDIRASE